MSYPELVDSKIISFDIETYDPELPDKGPGVYRRDGNVLGVALANDQGFQEYYNVGHPGTDMEEKQNNLKFIRDVLALPMKKLGAGILYDMDWLENFLGIKVNGELHDVQIAEPLINENQRVSLELLADKYKAESKRTHILQDFCDDHGLAGDPRKYIYMMPFEMVREYALGDVLAPLEIFQKQWAILKSQDLLTIYTMEMELIPLLLQMRMTGVPIDLQAIEEGIAFLKNFVSTKSEETFAKYGEFNVNSSIQVARVFDRLGVAYPSTAKGHPNIDKSVLEYTIDHPIATDILSIRGAMKVGTFFINAFLGHNVNGRIHCMFHPNKTEKYGTKSGRFSSTNPNLQQVPARDEVFGPLCRRVFVPEVDCTWAKIDWNQIEYRLIAHYGIGENAEVIRNKYRNDSNTDYHKVIMDLTGLTRKRSKTLNFGMAYAMGAFTMSKKFGWDIEECEEMIALYNEEVPFVRATRSKVSKVARNRGHITTILGRRARVTPEMLENKKEYQMFNRLIQGSAADLMKKAMRDAYDDGIFNVLIPHLTVHDELDFSIPRTKEGTEATMELKRIMETCVKLKVPVIADLEVGPNWADVEEVEQLQL